MSIGSVSSSSSYYSQMNDYSTKITPAEADQASQMYSSSSSAMMRNRTSDDSSDSDGGSDGTASATSSSLDSVQSCVNEGLSMAMSEYYG